MQPLNSYIDHTNLKPTATKQDIEQLCQEAMQYQFFSVCVPAYYVAFCKSQLAKTNIKVCTVISFPHGNEPTLIKQAATEEASINGADEIDYVINLHMVKNQEYKEILAEMRAIKTIAEKRVVKVILEICELNKNEITKLCELAVTAGLDFVKTSTGFGQSGATVNALKLMKATVNNKVEIKASGGIRDYNKCQEMIKAGATRIGTSSSVRI